MKKVRAHLTIEGIVQGVYFRSNTSGLAGRHNCSGWVRNTSAGSVEAVIEGAEADVKKVVEWCRSGPPMARVDRVQARWEEYQGEFDGFSVIS